MMSFLGWVFQQQKRSKFDTEDIELIYLAQKVTSVAMKGHVIKLRDFKIRKATGLLAHLNQLQEYSLGFTYAIEQNEVVATMHVVGAWRDNYFVLHSTIFADPDGKKRIVRIESEGVESFVIAEDFPTRRPDSVPSPSAKQTARARAAEAGLSQWPFKERLAAVKQKFSQEKRKEEAA